MSQLLLGDCLEVTRRMEAGSFDAIVTDPPSGTHFMGAAWDHHKGGRTQWVAWLAERMAEARRVIKPGHYALVWALPRTSHWTACALEDAGWTLVERVAHVFGTGFPKSKARLKPAVEDWWLCRAPGGGKVRELGIDACRIQGIPPSVPQPIFNSPTGKTYGMMTGEGRNGEMSHASGRWPSNFCLTHSASCRPAGTRKVKGSHDGTCQAAGSMAYHGNGGGTEPRATYAAPDGTETIDAWLCSDDCPVRLLDEQAGERKSGSVKPGYKRNSEGFSGIGGSRLTKETDLTGYGDSGHVSRFFPTFAWNDADFFPLRYCSKASKSDRGEGNTHNTVKPTALIRWLCRLITSPGGTILDPFAGSGTTLVAAIQEGFDAIGIEQDADYLAMTEARLAALRSSTPLFPVA